MTHQAQPRRPGIGHWQDPPPTVAAMTALADSYGITFNADLMRLLTTDRADLDIRDRRRRYTLGLALEPVPCPHCHTLTCRLAASTLPFSFTEDIPDDEYVCPSCGTKLTWHVELIGGAQWFTITPFIAAPPTLGQYNPLDLEPPPLAETVSQERAFTWPPGFVAGEPVEFMDRSRGAQWEPGTFLQYDPANEQAETRLAVVTYADTSKGTCRTEVTRIRSRCICEGRGGHINPACRWYGTDQDGGA